MKRVFICSRYAGEIEKNIETAKRLCRKALEQGLAPFAPHLHYTQFMNDEKPEEREAGISCGLAFLKVCDLVWVFVGDGISNGMRREIDHATRLGKIIVEIEEV